MVIIPGLIEGIATRKDRTLSIRIGTQELTPSASLDVFSLNQQFCYIAFKVNDFKTTEKDILENINTDFEDNKKTDSQRLRSVLYLCFQKDNKGYADFKSYYAYEMNKIIEHFKTKLD